MQSINSSVAFAPYTWIHSKERTWTRFRLHYSVIEWWYSLQRPSTTLLDCFEVMMISLTLGLWICGQKYMIVVSDSVVFSPKYPRSSKHHNNTQHISIYQRTSLIVLCVNISIYYYLLVVLVCARNVRCACNPHLLRISFNKVPSYGSFRVFD